MDAQDRKVGYWLSPLLTCVWFVVSLFVRGATSQIFIMAALVVVAALYLWDRHKISIAFFKTMLASAGAMVIFNIVILVSPLLPWQTITILVVFSAIVGWIVLHWIAGKRLVSR